MIKIKNINLNNNIYIPEIQFKNITFDNNITDKELYLRILNYSLNSLKINLQHTYLFFYITNIHISQNSISLNCKKWIIFLIEITNNLEDYIFKKINNFQLTINGFVKTYILNYNSTCVLEQRYKYNKELFLPHYTEETMLIKHIKNTVFNWVKNENLKAIIKYFKNYYSDNLNFFLLKKYENLYLFFYKNLSFINNYVKIFHSLK